MKYFELSITVFLKQDLHYKNSLEKISKLINQTMLLDKNLKAMHKENRFKHYCFDNFFPIADNGIYKNGSIYIFRIRSLDEDFMDKISLLIKKPDNEYIKVLASEKKEVKQFFIQSIESITPVIVSVDIEGQKHSIQWTMERDGDIMKLQKQLHENLLKKYKSFYGEKLEEAQNFIQLLEIKNQKPQTIHIEKNEKKIKLFGNKFKIIPNEDEVSQKLAFLALGCGLGEKQSYGGGFVFGRMG